MDSLISAEAGGARWAVLLAAIIGAAQGGALVRADGGEEFPYRATIRSATADVLSGPGAQYFPTAKLTRGASVEVYASQGDFLSIRPPEGSFSLVAKADLETTANGFGVVKREGAPSRVGSEFGGDHDAVHVRLRKNERVRVLSFVEIDGVEWAKIAPPSGEFRWIRAADIAERPAAPDETSDPASLIPGAETGATGSAMNLAPRPSGAVVPVVHVDDASGSAWIQPLAHETPATSLVSPIASAPAGEPSALIPPPTPVAGAAPSAGLLPPKLSSPLSSLEIELSRRVAGPVRLWRLDDLALDAARLADAAPDERQRQQAVGLAERIERFAAIANRARQLGSATPVVSRTRRRVSAPPTVSTPATLAPPAGELVGELRTVVSKTPGAPSFALVDEQGRVTAFVTPQAGMDLRPLIGRRVSASGVQGYLPQLRSRHVAATRVAQLLR